MHKSEIYLPHGSKVTAASNKFIIDDYRKRELTISLFGISGPMLSGALPAKVGLLNLKQATINKEVCLWNKFLDVQ